MTHGSKGKLRRYITDERYPQTAKANLTMANMLIASDNKRYGTLFLFQEGLFGIENHPAAEPLSTRYPKQIFSLQSPYLAAPKTA
jgi:hypothetical protein